MRLLSGFHSDITENFLWAPRKSSPENVLYWSQDKAFSELSYTAWNSTAKKRLPVSRMSRFDKRYHTVQTLANKNIYKGNYAYVKNNIMSSTRNLRSAMMVNVSYSLQRLPRTIIETL